ncbi:fam-c protein [Plasmodium vinckei lentum]|uniref:Fam-c protein n=1 Tax=Plasmodium vinckei lentum TaxID=138297 RepID=A0A6V7S8A0_PLAVN|nr:fam-c protein [Plasmodium vinckei lentum]
MNKKIYSLITDVSCIFLIATIQCFTNNLRLKAQQIKIYIEKYRSLSGCVVEDNYTLGFTMIKEPSADKQSKGFNFFNCFNIFKRYNKTNNSSDNN